MEKIDREEFEKRLARISDLFADMVQHADEQSKTRCPYKNRFNQCTAKFGCQNKRPPRASESLPACVSDDALDYRGAWEANPQGYEEMRDQLQSDSSAVSSEGGGPRVICGDQQCSAVEGRTIFDCADQLSVAVPTSCGRHGHCHECVVQIKSGMQALSQPTEAESFLRDNYRLACQAVIQKTESDIEFTLLRRSPRILTSSVRRQVEREPMVRRQGDEVLYGGEVIDHYRGHVYGLAIDLGTTTVAAELVDLESGNVVYEVSFENPQRFGGSDIMHRISYDGGEANGELHRAIINTLNAEIRSFCAQLPVTRHEIYEIVVVGNSTMRDIFFNLDVQSIGQKPYKSSIENEYLNGNRDSTELVELARTFRLYTNRNARVFGVPLIASHVGADVTANLVAMDVSSQSDVFLLVDAGTNTEVVIGTSDRLIAASCPAGPAFEGGVVTYGMPGCDGAIESVRYDAKARRFDYKTIGDGPPQGICGSGLIDLLAELRRYGIMTPKGVFADKARELEIVSDYGITLSRKDASELAQAKAANYCGQIILMRKFGVKPSQIHKLFLAGGFANYVDSGSAIDIGFLAPVPTDRIVKLGNAALQGARELLLSQSRRRAIGKVVQSIEHVELETMSDFFEVFVEGCQFKPMDYSE